MTTTTSMTIGTTYDRYRGAQDLLAHRDPNAAYRVLAELLDEATADASRADDLGGAQLAAIRAELARAAYHSARLDITADLARESLADDPTDVDALVLLVRSCPSSGRARARSGSPRMSRACRCATRSSSPSRRPRSIGSRPDGSSSGWARGHSGTASPRRAVRAALPARRSTP